jgi:23S rRNA pseudouridine1911/1915/1917 synthase
VPISFKDAVFDVAPGASRAVDRVLRDGHPGASWNDVRKLVRTGKVRVNGVVVLDPATMVAEGSRVAVQMAAPRPTAAGSLPRDVIEFVDAHVVVVRKPAGIATVPYEDERDTLDRLVQSLLRKTARPGTSVAPLGVVQRLDKETSGLIVFARTSAAKRGLQQQFRAHTVRRRYRAIVHGDMESRTVRSRLVRDRGDGLRGSTEHDELGRESTTHIRTLERLVGATLIECVLETGRTHQIRIHLSEVGHPLVGERVYVRNYGGSLISAPRVMLHAAELGFEHPVSGAPLDFRQATPEDMAGMVESLRRHP